MAALLSGTSGKSGKVDMWANVEADDIVGTDGTSTLPVLGGSLDRLLSPLFFSCRGQIRRLLRSPCQSLQAQTYRRQVEAHFRRKEAQVERQTFL
jgi:hypothetical protein